jgi:hypothetical protein
MPDYSKVLHNTAVQIIKHTLNAEYSLQDKNIALLVLQNRIILSNSGKNFTPMGETRIFIA